METGGIILIVCGGIFVLTFILIGCLGKMREKRTVTNEPINQKSRNVTSNAGGFTFYPAAASLPPVSDSSQVQKMKETVTNGPDKKPNNQRSTAPVTRSNGIGGGFMFLSAASLSTASVSSNHGYGGGGGHHGGGGGGGCGGGGGHDGGGGGGGCGGG